MLLSLFCSKTSSLVIKAKTNWKSQIISRITFSRLYSSQNEPESEVPKTTTTTTTPKGKSSDLSVLEIRIGKIVAIAKHPEADSLYVEQVDVGEVFKQ